MRIYDFQTDETYTYDSNGNRTISGYATADHNRLTSDGTWNYTYDGEGNVLTKTSISTSESVEYTWDHRNRLVKVTFKNSGGTPTKIVEYAYDYAGQMVERSVDTNADSTADERRISVHDAGQVAFSFRDEAASDLDGSDLERRYLWNSMAMDSLLADERIDGTQTADDILWPLADQLNSNRDIVRYNTGTDTVSVANHLTYDAFGNVTSETNSQESDDTAFHHTGKNLDEHTSLQWHQYLWYDPSTGRWISEDPIGFSAEDVNLYRYVGNGPQNASDPTGSAESPIVKEIPVANPGGTLDWVLTLIGKDLGGQLPKGKDWTPTLIWKINTFNGSATLSGGVEKTWTETVNGEFWAGIVDVTDSCGRRWVYHKFKAYSVVYTHKVGYYLSVKVQIAHVAMNAAVKPAWISVSLERFDIVEGTYSLTGNVTSKLQELEWPSCDPPLSDNSFDVSDEMLQAYLDIMKSKDAASGKTYQKITHEHKFVTSKIGKAITPGDIWNILKQVPTNPMPPSPGPNPEKPAS